MAHAFAKAGATQIAILARTEKTLQANKEAIEADFPGVKVIYVIADIVDKTAVASAFTSITAQLGKIDICVNNAGYMPAVSAIKDADADADAWWRGDEVNVRGSFNVVQAFLPAASDHPYLINVTTGAAILPPIPGFSSYATTKIIGVKLFEYVLAESPHVHVVSVHPGA